MAAKGLEDPLWAEFGKIRKELDSLSQYHRQEHNRIIEAFFDRLDGLLAHGSTSKVETCSRDSFISLGISIRKASTVPSWIRSDLNNTATATATEGECVLDLSGVPTSGRESSDSSNRRFIGSQVGHYLSDSADENKHIIAAPTKLHTLPSTMPERLHSRMSQRTGRHGRVACRFLDWWIETPEQAQSDSGISGIVKGRFFELLCISVILCNGMFVLHSANWEIQNLEQPVPAYVSYVEWGFLCFYTLELLLKWCVYGRFFLCSASASWNWLDLVLVVFAIFEVLVTWLSGSDGAANLSFLRLVRLFKVGRLLRMARAMRAVKQLKLFLLCLINSLSSLVWALCMIFFVLILFAMYFMQAVTGHLLLKRTTGNFDNMLEGEEASYMEVFGSVELTLLALLQCISGGREWELVFDLVHKTGTLNGVAFVFFILLFFIVIWNIVTSVFLEKTLDLARPDLESLMLDKVEQDIRDTKELMFMCSQCDPYATGRISNSEFKQWMCNPKFKSYFDVRGIDFKDANCFFRMLATSGEDEQTVDMATFVGGCMRLKGYATSLDLNSLIFETRGMHALTRGIARYSEDRFRSIDENLAELRNHLHAPGTTKSNYSTKCPNHVANLDEILCM